MNHSFNVEHAQAYGVGEAILIHHFVFWIAKNKANGRHFYDGRTWTYNSIDAFTSLLPYYSSPQIKRLLISLKEQGVLVTGNYNKFRADRTLWYAFADEKKFVDVVCVVDEERISIRRNRQMDFPISENGKDEIGKSESMKSSNAFSETVPPIPDNKPYNKTNKRASPMGELNISFESFWDLYDKKRDRPACEKKWAALTDAERQAVITHLPAYVRSTPDKKFRRDPATYLNNRSWENEIISPLPTPVTIDKPVYKPPKWKTGADWN